MSTVLGLAAPSAEPVLLPAWVVASQQSVARGARQLLEAAGFSVVEDDPDTAGRADEGLLLLLGDAAARDRVGEIRERAGAHTWARIITAMPSDAPNSMLRRALRAGADGIVVDHELPQTLVPTARAVAAGQLSVPRAIRHQIAPPPLSFREKQILDLVVRGLTNRAIAAELFVAESTVKTHLSSIFTKLDAHSRAEAVSRILDPDDLAYQFTPLASGQEPR